MSAFHLFQTHKNGIQFLELWKRKQKWVWFWAAALLMLFFHLGMNSIIGSEARWLVIVREMISSGDFLHPTINRQLYFDKPLLTYWFGLLPAWGFGEVSELTIRIPSALFGLLALGSLISLARTLYHEKIAYLSAWIMLTTYSFIYWGRLGEADMENMALILAATAVYFKFRDKRSFWAYLFFWFLCAVGAQTKGLAALVIPPLLVLLDCIVCKKLLFHLNWKMILAMIFGIFLYLVPFLLDPIFGSKGFSAEGLTLVYRENLVRVFNPWDHKNEPFWCYFKFLPRLELPWTPFCFLAFLFYAVRFFRNRKDVSDSIRWNLLTITAIFLIFTISKSRRVYYILPIIPYCVLLTAVFFQEEGCSRIQKITHWLLKTADFLIPVVAVIAVLQVLIVPRMILSRFLPADAMDRSFSLNCLCPIISAAGILVLLFHLTAKYRKRKKEENRENCSTPYPELTRFILSAGLILFFAFALIHPLTGSDPEFRPEKAFLRSIRDSMVERGTPAERVAFYGSYKPNVTCYLDLDVPAKHFSVNKEEKTIKENLLADSCKVGNISEFRRFISDVKANGGMIVISVNDLITGKDFPSDIREEFLKSGDGWELQKDVVMEPFTILERQKIASAKSASAAEKFRRKYMRKKILVKFYDVQSEGKER